MYIEDYIENNEEKSLEENSMENNSVDESQNEEIQSKEVLDSITPSEESSSDDVSSKKIETEEKNDNKNTPKFNFKNLIGRKIGMTQLFSNEGNIYPATIIEAGPCSITQIKNLKNDGYDSVQIGFSDMKDSKVNNSLRGHFKKSKSNAKKILKEFRVNKVDNLLKIGDIVDLNQFNVGDFIKVRGKSIGKGFAGHMKRHGFSGGRASHGKNSVMRKAGSVGAGTDPGRVFPGMKMAGRMGNNNVTIKNLQVLSIDYDNNLIFVKGAVPGFKNNYLFLTKD